MVAWLLLGWPLVVDRWLDASEPPVPADAIVCIGGGVTGSSLPTADGWQRIYTAVQLFADGYAPVVVFSGRGTTSLSEAEIYRDAAVWLGLPPDAALLDPLPERTAEHPVTLLRVPGERFARDSSLVLVTSRLHSRRVLLTFRKQGFSKVRVVAVYRAAQAPATLARHTRVSTLKGYSPSDSRYDDPFRRLASRTDDLMVSLRESTAIAWYWWQGLL